MNFCSYTSYISGNGDKALGIRLLRGFGVFSVLCKVFSSGTLQLILANLYLVVTFFSKDRLQRPWP